MIEKAEVDAKASELEVHTSDVQRDYVFGWLLAGLYQPESPLRRDLVLKGGNALRKAYFEHARYSNDLDFAATTGLSEIDLTNALIWACEYAGDLSGIEFVVENTRVDSRSTGQDGGSLYEARVYFKSFYGEEHFTLKVDLDVTDFDKLILPVQERRLVHAYSDVDDCIANLKAMKIEELLASKLVALLQRHHSPDLFDFVYSIFFQKSLAVSRSEVLATFLKRSIYQPSPVSARNLLLDLPFAVLKGLWHKYLVLPRTSVITFETAESTFRNVIDELFALVPAAQRGTAPGKSPEYFGSAIRGTLLEAGRLQRVVSIVYDGLRRNVEPYALAFKRRKDGVGREYFYAWDRSGGHSGSVGIKSFLPQKIASADITDEVFAPRFPIEMAKSGIGYFTSPSFGTTRSRYRYSRSAGAPYTVECHVCGKAFRRKTPSVRVHAHKDQFGNACYGRTGFLT